MDNSSLKRREELAITAAIAAGNTERARHTAERLFGLRLDTDTQIRLSGQMHQLGLHELADALLGRASRRAGGQGDALVSLMTQYQRQGKLEPAAQVAMQVLRATRTNQVSLRNFVVTLDADSVRTTAMRVLAASGRLPQLIERTQEQLKKTPNSVAIHHTLADYFTAARQNDRAGAELARIIELKPDDADLRLKLALQLADSGDSAAALRHYKVVFEKNPSLAADAIFQMSSIFTRAGKTTELIELLNGVDAKALSFSSITYLINLIQLAPTDPRTSDLVHTLYRKAWAAFPDTRYMMVNRVARPDFVAHA